jgi:cell division GTPase FtsZ|tara:strand:- start:2344 stop:3507 length:1164 start_codon:yes stop_codon:yes gene_type:complete
MTTDLPDDIQEEQSVEPDIAIDVSIPDMLLPPPAEEESVDEIKDDVDVSFNFAFIGAGQGGSRLAETFHTLGYRKIAAINTAEQDLNTVKIDNKLLIGDGGAGKDRQFAKDIFSSKREDVIDFMRYSFGDHLDRIFVCAGAGGGTGAGVACQLANAAHELQETVNAKSKQVGMILALPKKAEGAKVAANASDTLIEAWELVKSGVVSPLIILDNERINKLYPKLVVSNFWNTANMSVAGLFHLFNLTTAKDSTYTSFDSNDYKTLLDSGLMVFGASPVKDWKDPVSISRAIRENLQNNLLSGDIDLATGDTAAAVIIGNKEQLDNIPQSSVDQAVSQLNRVLKPGSTVHSGIYTGDRDTLTIFTAIGGLGMPHKVISNLVPGYKRNT